MEDAIRDTCTQCNVFERSGPPAPLRKISLTHDNQNFNDGIQVDFLFVRIRRTIFSVIQFCDAGTVYSEGSFLKNRKSITVLNQFGQLWGHRHGVPNHISGDEELSRTVIAKEFSKQRSNYKDLTVQEAHVVQHNFLFLRFASCGFHSPHVYGRDDILALDASTRCGLHRVRTADDRCMTCGMRSNSSFHAPRGNVGTH